MISPVLIFILSFLCQAAIAGRTCPKPDALPFATVLPLKSFYEPGEQIEYSCLPGYTSWGGMRRFTCPLSGRWPINTMRCKPRVCPFAGILENGAVRYTTFEYPNMISFSCNAGFYLNGTNSAKCTEEGKWNPDLPVCAPITCPPPPTPKFAVLSEYKPLAANSSLDRDSAVFKCLPHYAMFGNDTITCTVHGNWTELPECKEVKCPFPSRPNNGFVNYPAKEILYYKDKATYGCHDTFVLDGPEEVECNRFGHWSAQPSCKVKTLLTVAKINHTFKLVQGNGAYMKWQSRIEILFPRSLESDASALTLCGYCRGRKVRLGISSCKISVKKATVIYEGERVKIQEKFKNGMLHGQKVSFFCKNKEKKCSYTEDAQCIDGTFEIPTCFKEHSSLAFWKTDASDVKPCEAEVQIQN